VAHQDDRENVLTKVGRFDNLSNSDKRSAGSLTNLIRGNRMNTEENRQGRDSNIEFFILQKLSKNWQDHVEDTIVARLPTRLHTKLMNGMNERE
jgi:hypothetical protein